ncbi:glutamate ABC transporter substrate-binding protein [Aestuariimicrobium sp. p3-SID1156]|uniref:glutamate ABC transporter substrate-binding protein n=1 Tax=Aestuariimicrobium sp. p3-SID1156 TaxID=2916038 RepID=UPI00223AA444|nr:glutamate ABC transporter substrate-binding protein [Aestuariimicrobium sp. p3-SID1156]MCT1459097.1 glutamate ABC transporter substrate-binding protein [Aestuariimicrobium sp. p3-SID1156]
MKFTKFAAAATGAVLALSLTACGGGDKADDKIAIGIKFDQPGLGQKVGGNYEGFDVEVAKYVAKELGYSEDKIEFKESPSPQRENLIMTGQVKLIFATYSITDSRKEKISFGGPYFIAGQDLLVKNDSDITSVDGLKGKKLCSVTGSTSATKVKEKVPGVQLQEFDTYSKCVDALANGSIDAVTTDDVILAGFAAQDAYKGKLKVVGAPFSEERYGVGLKKGDKELCEKVNTAIKKMIDSGEWTKALEKTVGPSGYKAPTPPAQDACA